MIEELSKQNESTQGALIQKCTEVNRHKEEAAQLIKDKEELQSRVLRVNDLLKLMTSTLCDEKGRASWVFVAFLFWQLQMIHKRNVTVTECRLDVYKLRNIHTNDGIENINSMVMGMHDLLKSEGGGG